MAAPTSTLYESLTRRHGAKVECRVSVEECCLAVNSVVGHSNVVSASRMNSAVVLFLNTVERTNGLVQTGIVLQDQLTPVHPLSTPAKKVILSNIPPFIKDEHLARELSRFGKLVSPIRKIPLGCKSPLVRHLVSFRRVVYMVLKDGADTLDVTFKLRVDGFDYPVFVPCDTDIRKVWLWKQDPVFKTPVKRKKGRVRSAASKQAKQGERGDDTDTDDGQSDSGWSMSSQEDTSSTVYTAGEIKAFLQRTKGQKLVQVAECISDWSQFVHDVGHFRREKAFTELELYRLKKLLTRLRKESTDDGHAVG
ncbi:hypothetical protein NFI96_005412 [Prochilodus magdalenae]|nr:hypothetical protein NFI96_005412 [Prochilodus magdalenae]